MIKTTIIWVSVIVVPEMKTKMKSGRRIVMVSYRVAICAVMIKGTVKSAESISWVAISIIVVNISNPGCLMA